MKRLLVLVGLLLTGGASYAHMDGTFATFHDDRQASSYFQADMGEPDPGHAYEDVHNTGAFVNGTDIKIDDEELQDGTYNVQDPQHGLVIPESVPAITSTHDVNLTAGEHGHLLIATPLTADRDLALKAGTHLQAPHLNLTAHRDVTLAAGQGLTLNRSLLDAGRDAQITAEATMHLEDATLTAHRDISLNADGALRGYQASLDAHRDLQVTSGKGLALVHAHLQPTRDLHVAAGQDARLDDATINATKMIHIQAGEDVLVTRATLDTDRAITLTAGSSQDAIFVQDARFHDRDDTATVAPDQVEIIGEPAHGSTKNADDGPR